MFEQTVANILNIYESLQNSIYDIQEAVVKAKTILNFLKIVILLLKSRIMIIVKYDVNVKCMYVCRQGSLWHKGCN